MRTRNLGVLAIVALAVGGVNASGLARATEPIVPPISDETAEGKWESVSINENGELLVIRLGVFIRLEKSFLTICRSSITYGGEGPYCEEYEVQYVQLRDGALLAEGRSRIAGELRARVEIAGTGTANKEWGQLKTRLVFKDVHGLSLERIECVLIRQHPSVLDTAAAALKSFRKRAK